MVGIVIALVLSLVSCGKSGGGDAPARPKPPKVELPPPVTGSELLTSVGLDGMGYTIPPPSSCLAQAKSFDVPALPVGAVVLDGKLDEWTDVPARLDDPIGDAPAQTPDLAQVFVASAGDELILAASVALPEDGVVHFTIGGAYSRDGRYQSQTMRELRVRFGGALEERRDGAWVPVAADLGLAAQGANAVELRLTSRLVGEVVNYPLWWARAGAGADVTATVFFPSRLHGDREPFKLAACTFWYTRKLPLDMVEVRDSASNEALDERVFQIARLAVDEVVRMFGDAPLPLRSLTVIATASAVDDTGDFEPDASDGPATYGAIAVNTASFAAGSPQRFPEGPLFNRIALRIVDLYLHAIAPNAPFQERRVMGEALAQRLLWSVIGPSFVFDHYRAGILPYLADPSAAGWSSIVAQGRILSSVLSTEQLIAAWHERAAGDAGPAPSVATILATLTSEALSDQDQDGIPRHWEEQLGTDPDVTDSDGDSWSDLAEIVRGRDPLALTSGPQRIMPDGDFDDWLTLFPKKVMVDLGRSGACPVAADITHYAAVTNQEELVIGAVARDFWESEPNAVWEAIIDLPIEKRQLMLTVASDAYSTTVRDPNTGAVLAVFERAFPQGRRTVEWVLRRDTFGIERPLDEVDGVKIRLRTLLRSGDQDLYCDETAWFSPYVSQGS